MVVRSLADINTRGPSGPRIAQFNAVVSNDFADEYARASERKVFRGFGHNGSIPIGQSEDLWHGSTALYSGWLSAPAQLRIKAGGNANDTSNGTGARSVVLHPHDGNFNWVDDDSVVLATNGASASTPTSQSFSRCTRAFVQRSGAYANGSTSGTNAGLVTIETVGGVEVAAIDAGDGEAEMGIFTVPAGYALWLEEAALNVDSNAPVVVQLFQRPEADVASAPFFARRSVLTLAAVTDAAVIGFDYLLRFGPKTDLWWRATAGANNTGVSVQWNGLLLSID